MNLQIEHIPTGDLKPYPKNARTHSDEQVAAIAQSIETFGFLVPVLIDATGELIAGHGRVEAAKLLDLPEVPAIKVDHLTDAQQRAYLLADNKLTERGGWDKDILAAELRDLKDAGVNLGLTGFEDDELYDLLRPDADPDDPAARTLTERFLVPPFSVLDARQEYWQQRKREWLSLGIQSELGRDAPCLPTLALDRGRKTDGKTLSNGTSVFDPVLCELAYRWFCPPEGNVLDPFAGGSVRGIVAGRMKRHYTGIDLRPEQVTANQQQAAELCTGEYPPPTYHAADSTTLPDLLPADYKADLLFSCPPYADLERYSDDPRDLSTHTYDDFRRLHAEIIRKTCDRLKDNRFAVWVVGEVRGKDGSYLGLVPDTIAAFRDAGLSYYGEAIYVTPCGSLPLRTGTAFMKSRKLGKTHQQALIFHKGAVAEFKKGWRLGNCHHNYLIFAKGDPKAAAAAATEADAREAA
ncbi:MAG: site-specific DNA-methyltransferase [Planctomycetota bacterium]